MYKKVNVKYILILVLAIFVIAGVFVLALSGGSKEEQPLLGTETEGSELESIGSENVSTEMEETESSEEETTTPSEVETEEETEVDNNNSSATNPDAGLVTQPDNNSTGNANNTGNSGSSGSNNSGGNISDIAPDYQEYDPRDTNKDGSVSVEEEMMYITPAKQKCIDAGYGVVVELDGGTWYAVLMQSNEQTINGKYGNEILREYLKEHGLHAKRIGGCWINMDNGWYWYTAEQIEVIPEDPDDNGEIDWDDIEWEDSY